MMWRILGRWLKRLSTWLTRPPMWVPSVRYLQRWPQARPGKTGVAAARRAARKARNRRRQRYGRA